MTDLSGPEEGTTIEPAYVQSPAGGQAPAKPRSWRRSLVAVATVLAVGGGAFGVASLAQNGGPQSPEAAVTAMFDAIGREDAIGVLETLAPEERDLLRPAVDDMRTELTRLKVASPDADLRKVQGLELDVTGLEATSTTLGDGVASVQLVKGRITSSVAVAKLPLGSVVRKVLDRDDIEVDPAKKADADLKGVKLVAVKRNGGWRVSLLYSLAEQLRRDTDPEPAIPAYGKGIAVKGAASPEAAVREGIDAAITGDFQRLIELTPGDEARVLHDYGPVLLANASAPEPDQRWTVDGLQLKIGDGGDGRKVVTPTSFKVTLPSDVSSERVTIAYDGRCTTITAPRYVYDPGYGDGGVSGDLTSRPSTQTEVTKSCRGDGGGQIGFGTGQDLRIVVEQHDGQWFLSPTRSIVAMVVDGLKAADEADVTRQAELWRGSDQWRSAPDEIWAACGVARPAPDTKTDEGEIAFDDCVSNLPPDYSGPAPYSFVIPFPYPFWFFLPFSTGAQFGQSIDGSGAVPGDPGNGPGVATTIVGEPGGQPGDGPSGPPRPTSLPSEPSGPPSPTSLPSEPSGSETATTFGPTIGVPQITGSVPGSGPTTTSTGP